MLFTRKKDADASQSTDLSSDIMNSPEFFPSEGGYLQGQLLVATPLVTGSAFEKSVIFLFAHNAEGAMGVIINQPLELVHYSTLLDEHDIPDAVVHESLPVYHGGPVDKTRGFVVHSDDYTRGEPLMQTNGLAITANSSILRDMIADTGPQHARLAVGYAGWSAGQLEAEIEQNSWITVPADPKLVFETEDELKWTTASQTLGIDMNFFSHAVGHA